MILVGSWCFLFFYGSRAFLMILGGSWRFFVVPNDLLVIFYGSQGFFVLLLIVLGDS